MGIVFTGLSNFRAPLIVGVLVASLIPLLGNPSAQAKTYDAGTEASADYLAAEPIAKVIPELPHHVKDQCFKSCCIARFMINADGTAKVKLLSSTGSDEIDDITLQSLRRWKFKPAMLDGKPVSSTRRIKVEFEID